MYSGTGGRREAQITVFLSLLLLLMTAAVLSLLESARVQACRARGIRAAHLGMFSLFGEYDRDMLEMYDIFLLDGGFGEGSLREEVLLEHLYREVQTNSRADGLGSALTGAADYSGLSLQGVDIEVLELVTDNGCQGFLSQACDYAAGSLLPAALEYGGDCAEALVLGEETLDSSGDLGENLEELREQAREEAEEDARDQGISVPSDIVEGLEFENPIQVLRRYISMGILGLAADEDVLSDARMDSGTPFSRRNAQTGRNTGEAGGVGIADSLLFHEYILDKFPCFSAELPEDFPALRYQCEYLFGGEEEDRENLKAYLNRLLLVRLGFNTVYLAGSSARQAELEALASAMTGAVGLPMLSGLVKAALEILWAYEESLVDIRTLCTGGEVPLMKDDSSFACSIQQIFSFAPEPQKEAEGLDYREYMRLLLNTLPMEEKAARALDMAEHTIRVLRDRGSFQVDSGIFRMEVYAAFRGEGIFSGRAGGYTWSTRAGYTYGES